MSSTSLCQESLGHTWTKFFSTFKNISTFLSILEGFCRSNLRLFDIKHTVRRSCNHPASCLSPKIPNHDDYFIMFQMHNFRYLGEVNIVAVFFEDENKKVIVWKQEYDILSWRLVSMSGRCEFGSTPVFYWGLNKSTYHPCSLLNL